MSDRNNYPKLYFFMCGLCLVLMWCLIIQSSRSYDVFISYIDQTEKQKVVPSKQDKVAVKYHPEPYIKHGDHDVFYHHATKEEFWDDHPITVYEAIAQHKRKTLESCDNRCDEVGCDVTRLADWNRLNKGAQLPYTPFLARGQYVFPWEKTYLSRPPLEDSRALPDLTLSKVTVEGVVGERVQCNVSDTVHGRVDLVDGYGNFRTRGDDEVRVWVKSLDQVGFAASGNVTDLKNGSYLFTFLCLWPGMSTLNVAVAYPREFIRTAIHQIHIGVTRFMGMTFSKGNTSETTLCWPTPNIPGRPCVCNMTHNGQETYYCGRPINSRLTCDDWQHSEFMELLPQPHDVTKAEMTLIKKSTGTASSTLIKHKIKIFANSGSLPKPSPCLRVSPRPTWGSAMPKGYWSPGLVWNSLLCQCPGNITTGWTLNCLRNTTVWIFGDSNGNRTFTSLVDLTKCKYVVGRWPYESFCLMTEIGLNITCRSHENPRYTLLPRQHAAAPVSAVLDTVPESGRHVIILHYYLHYTPSHLGVLYLRMKKLRRAVEKLLQRNEKVVIGIRGPHISTAEWNANHAIGGDSLGQRYVDIIKSIFRGLEDRVIYLDTWDMSIGIENKEFHPPYELTKEMVKFMLSFFCQ